MVHSVSRDRWSAGEQVFVRGRRWRVEESTPYSDCSTLRLTATDFASSTTARTFLLPFDRPRPLQSRSTIESVDVMRPRRWLWALRRAAMDVRPFGSLSAAISSQIDLLPYQLEPAMAMLRHGHTRLLIADSVGLGKTIQAGLIIRELLAEREGFRALVVTPAGLREQWAAELAGRFDIRAEIVTSTWLARAVCEVPADVGPWSLPGVYVCSFEYIRRPEVLRPLEDVGWDLLVVDEAHAATPASARRMAVHAVALRSRRVVLLTATPHGGEDAQFQSLCQIGLSDDRPDPLVAFCRSRSDVGPPPRRRSVLLPVRLSSVERRMHRLLERYTACVCAESDAAGNRHARLAAIVLRKRALSSAGSLAVSCRRRLALLAASPDAPQAEQLSLPLENEDLIDDDQSDFILGAPGLANSVRERRWIEAIINAADDAARHESKIALLTRLLGRIKEPVIVFTEYRDTLTRLQSALLTVGRDIRTLHGGMTAWERFLAQEQFNRAGSLLLATDAAAEGLNLQARCRMVLHFELPWSPSRLEQRTGRVDRIGQSRIVHEIMLVAADTAERLVLAPLAKRAARARRAASGFRLVEALSESRVASAVMDGTPIESAPAIPDAHTIPPPAGVQADARVEAARLHDLRRWRAAHVPPPRAPRIAATVMRVRRRMLPAGLIRVYILALAGRDGTIVHNELLAVHELVRSPKSLSRSRMRDFMATAADDRAATERSVLSLVRDHLEHVMRACTRTSRALADRERVVSLPVESAAKALLQGRLFDRRAVRAERERARVAAAILDEADRRLAALDARTRLTPSLTLTALLLVEDRTTR